MAVIHVGKHDQSATYKEADWPDAVTLSELELLKSDLLECLEALKALQNFPASEASKTSEGRTISTALLRSAMILWIGCFENPKKGDLSVPDIYGHIDGAVDFFKSARDVRDSYAAHRFGPQQLGKTLIAVKDGVAVGTLQHVMKYVSPGPKELARTAELVQIAVDAVNAKAEPLRVSVQLRVQGLSGEEVAALPDLKLIAPRPNEVRMSRRQYRELRRRT